LTNSKGPWVYLNNQGTSLIDIRTTCGIGEAPEYDSTDWHGFALGDYDGDGNLDLYISEGAKKGKEMKRDLLFKGNGDGTFTYVSDLAGIAISSQRGRVGFWLDYDNDGKLDLFVKNSFGLNVLYHNNGNGSFAQVPQAGGLDKASLGNDNGSVVTFADYNNDGYMDAFFAGDGENAVYTTDALYKNLGNGTFADVTDAAQIVRDAYGHGVAWGDYNNDGLLDFYVARVGGKSQVPQGRLYRNNGDGTFTDVTAEAGLSSTANTYCAAWGDYDNDGLLDLFVTNAGAQTTGVGNNNLLYHNNGDGTFTEVAVSEGLALQDNMSGHKGIAWADYDNDGFLDLVLKEGFGGENDDTGIALGSPRLFHNTGNSNHFIEVNLSGVQSNSRGIGASVTATYNGTLSFRQNNGGGGGENASQGSQPLHFGIGTATSATLTVRWPSGIVDVLPSVPANSFIDVVEGSTAQENPVILKQPQQAKVALGQTATFRVSASGGSAYQWLKNGFTISGATQARYTTPATVSGDNDSTFSVLVTNSSGSVYSNIAVLLVR
jgi:hypothetical protein